MQGSVIAPAERSVVVTGGAGPAIGSGVSTAVARHGYRTWIADLNLDAAEETAEILRREGLDTRAIRLDVSDPVSVEESFARIVAEEGAALAGLVNSAGIGWNALAADMQVEDYDRIMAIDLRGPWLCARAVLPALTARGGGSIVNIGSVHSQHTVATQTVYAAAKAGLAGMTRAIAADYGAFNVRCNIIHPGAVPSLVAYGDGSMPTGDAAVNHMVEDKQMLRQPISPVDIGEAAAFFLGEGSRRITAQELTVDAGLTRLLWTSFKA